MLVRQGNSCGSDDTPRPKTLRRMLIGAVFPRALFQLPHRSSRLRGNTAPSQGWRSSRHSMHRWRSALKARAHQPAETRDGAVVIRGGAALLNTRSEQVSRLKDGDGPEKHAVCFQGESGWLMRNRSAWRNGFLQQRGDRTRGRRWPGVGGAGLGNRLEPPRCSVAVFRAVARCLKVKAGRAFGGARRPFPTGRENVAASRYHRGPAASSEHRGVAKGVAWRAATRFAGAVLRNRSASSRGITDSISSAEQMRQISLDSRPPMLCWSRSAQPARGDAVAAPHATAFGDDPLLLVLRRDHVIRRRLPVFRGHRPEAWPARLPKPASWSPSSIVAPPPETGYG